MKSVLVTGAAGFIGSNLVRKLVAEGYKVLSADCLTYAGCEESLEELRGHPNHEFVEMDIRDEDAMKRVVMDFAPDWIFHLAAETHVDRSITGPMEFLKTNVLGTGSLLQAAMAHWKRMDAERAKGFRFIHCSTDEVFGSLGENDAPFTETSPYLPRSPYAASKAGSDHIVRAWGITYDLPVIVTNCSNNYGPWQFPEKLIPMVITNALEGRRIPVYGDGLQSRDWIHVDDHCEALALVAGKGAVGSTYLIGGNNEWRNIDLVRLLCELVGEATGSNGLDDLIQFVADRPGHDFRYGLDVTRIGNELGWEPSRNFKDGLLETVGWYSSHRGFWEAKTGK